MNPEMMTMMAQMFGGGGGEAGAGGGMGGFFDWYKKKYPEEADAFLKGVGGDGAAEKNQAMQMGMSAMKPELSLPQLQGLMGSAGNKRNELYNKNNAMRQRLGGLMMPPSVTGARPMGLMGR